MRWLLAAIGIVAAASLWGAGAAQAAAPPNDNYAAATPLAVGQEVNATDLEATAEPGEQAPNLSFVANSACLAINEGPDCGRSVWYLFQPSQSGEYTIETCDRGSDSATAIAAYTGPTVGSAALVGYKDGGSSDCPSGVISSRLQLAATAGTAYHVEVAGIAGGEGSFYLRDYAGPPRSRPLPDTASDRYSSLLFGAGLGTGVVSGPRHSPSFALVSTPPGGTFECSLDGSAFSPCDSVVSYEGLSPGSSHVFEARASLLGALDPTPLVQPFTIDANPPDSVIVSGPSGPIASQEATWRTAATERTSSGTTTCSLDAMPPSYCSPGSTTYKPLCQGPHEFRAVAVDRAGNVDPTPAVAHVDVTVGPSCAPPTIEPSGFESLSATNAYFGMKYDLKGAGGRIHVDYGPTAAYGMTLKDVAERPDTSSELIGLPFLDPGTTYHYRVTVTTPFGSASTGDRTFTTKPLEHVLQRIQNGTATVTPYAARVPAIVDPQGETTLVTLYVLAGSPVTLTSPHVFPLDGGLLTAFGGPQTVTFNITDLEPATTYHYRVSAMQHEGKYGLLGPEGTFTTPALKSPAAKAHFKLHRKSIRIGKLTRRSKKVTVKVRDLPAKTLIKVGLTAGKRHAGGRRRANSKGRVTLKIRFSKKFRAALHDQVVRVVRFRVTASPPGDTPSSVVLKRRLGR
jgi:hypothetical protein